MVEICTYKVLYEKVAISLFLFFRGAHGLVSKPGFLDLFQQKN